VAVHGLVAGDALREQQTLDAVNVCDPLSGQDFPLTADAALILFSGRWGLDHRTDPRLATLVGEKRTDQGFAIDLVGLRPPPPARGRDRRRIDDVALDPFALQDTVDPKAVQPGFLDHDQREELARPGVCPRLELGQARQQPGGVAAAHLMLRHLLPARRQGRDEPSRTREFQ